MKTNDFQSRVIPNFLTTVIRVISILFYGHFESFKSLHLLVTCLDIYFCALEFVIIFNEMELLSNFFTRIYRKFILLVSKQTSQHGFHHSPDKSLYPKLFWMGFKIAPKNRYNFYIIWKLLFSKSFLLISNLHFINFCYDKNYNICIAIQQRAFPPPPFSLIWTKFHRFLSVNVIIIVGNTN